MWQCIVFASIESYWKKRSLVIKHLLSFLTHLSALAIRPPFRKNNNFCKMALLNMGIIASWIESNLMISNYISCRYVIFIFFFLAIARWRTISHADQLRAVSTAQYRLSHGKAWHVLRWRVRFLIRVVLELTIRFNLSFPCLCSVTIHSERCNIRIRQIC